MPLEIEKSFAVEDEKALRNMLSRIGKHAGTFLFRQVNFRSKLPDIKTIRVRDEGSRIAFTVKRRTQSPFLEEDEKPLTCFDDALAVCSLLGLERMYYLEKLREIYHVESCTVTLDSYPGLPPMRLEIEAPTEDEMVQTAKRLGLQDAKETDAAGLYLAVYGITRERDLGDLTFSGAAKSLGPLIGKNYENFVACLDRQLAVVKSKQTQ
jgi:adenylate cyclase class IV